MDESINLGPFIKNNNYVVRSLSVKSVLLEKSLVLVAVVEEVDAEAVLEE